MIKKLIVLILAISLVIPTMTCATITPSPFGALLYKYGFIQGKGDGNLAPFDSLKRVEMIKMLVQLEPLAFQTFQPPTQPTFLDCPPDKWFFKWVEYAYTNGFTKGKGNQLFGAADNLTYNQASLFLANRLGLETADVEYRSASKIIGERYGIALQSTVPGDAFLTRDQAFELYAKAVQLAAIQGRSLLTAAGVSEEAIDAFLADYDAAIALWNQSQ